MAMKTLNTQYYYYLQAQTRCVFHTRISKVRLLKHPQDPPRLGIPGAAPQAGAGHADRRPCSGRSRDGCSCSSCSSRPGSRPTPPARPHRGRQPQPPAAPHLVAEDGPLHQAGIAVQAHPRVAAAPHGPTAGPAARCGRARSGGTRRWRRPLPALRRSGRGGAGAASALRHRGDSGTPRTGTGNGRGRLACQKPGCICKK